MLKLMNTLSKALLSSATDQVEQRHAVTILGQQVREAAASVHNAKKAVALVRAQSEQEKQRACKLEATIADLETRARGALKKNEETLAREAAEAIAVLEDERVSTERAQDAFANELKRLTANVHKAQARLRELQRGQRVVTARDQVRKVGNRLSISDEGALNDAEQTLSEIEQRQKALDLADTAYAEMTVGEDPSDIVERLADAGCGKPTTTRAADVLARLKKTPEPETTA